MAHGELAWETAEVRDGALTVEVSGDAGKKWGKRLVVVVDRLGSSEGWGKIKVSGSTVKVEDVGPGREADLRHVLEAAVLQANADLAEPEADEADDGPSGQDADMTEAFRSFAGEGAEPDGDDVS